MGLSRCCSDDVADGGHGPRVSWAKERRLMARAAKGQRWRMSRSKGGGVGEDGRERGRGDIALEE